MSNRRMGGVVLAAMVAVVLTCVGFGAARAAGTDVVWKKVPLLWASYGAGTVATGDSLKWQHISDENDSTRTAFRNTSDWAWDAFAGSGTAVSIATIECACQTTNMAVGNDTLYFAIEKRAPNGEIDYNAAMTAAIGTVATLQGAPGANGAVFRGALTYDNDALETSNLIGPGADFRLVVKGDQGSTTPTMGKCSLWITYPARRASSP